MSEKRRDNKGRILKTGESQRRDERYAYKFIDTFGKPLFIYAWKLVSTDKTPAGKRDDVSLRDKEKEIQNDINDGIDTIGKKMTVCQLYAKQTGQRNNVKRGTQAGRKRLMELLQNDILGARSIESVKLSDAKEWAIRMSEKGYAYGTINNYKRSLKASFYTAMQDDCIRKNPFDFAMNTVLADDTKPKEALTPEQEEKLISFMKTDKIYQKHCDEILLLLKTGLRVSEFCGLTVNDLNFQDRTINIDHQLLRDTEVGYYINTPKTKSGIRQVPMSEEVYQAFQRVLKSCRKAEPLIVDGYSNFLFLNRDGYPMQACNFVIMLKSLIKKYNKHHEEALPNVTPHIFRHTFCTRLANAGMNPKALQYIMGHSDISITLNLYAHASFDTVKAEIARLIA